VLAGRVAGRDIVPGGAG